MSNTNLQPFIKWSGSKRSQADKIIKYFPENINVYYEPFLGGGSILSRLSPAKAVCSDIYAPLIDIWCLAKNNPKRLINEYRKEWENLQNNGYRHYYFVRDRFNKKKSASDLLFLSRTCVNGLIRFNQNGEFNNSLHHSRKGINPDRLEAIIYNLSEIIKNYDFCSQDYNEILKTVKKDDFVYLDPPYFYTKGRYIEKIDHEKFLEFLKSLNKKGVKFALSYDGTRDNKDYKIKIPKHLYKKHLLIESGNSPFRKLQDKKNEMVRESLYLNY